MQPSSTQLLRALLRDQAFIYMPAVYYPLAGRLLEALGLDAAYVGGYVTGGSRAVSEPLLTLTEQVETAEQVARSIRLPVVCDAGAGFGEPLHVTRTVREFVNAGVAGIHIEDQLFPKRAHYHKYVAHAIPAVEMVDKIRFACETRDQLDPNFVIIARTDTLRFEGRAEAVKRINMCAEVGADMGLCFPMTDEDARLAPKECDIPLVYVQSRGNREGRPLYSMPQLQDMGYKACIDAQLFMLASLHFARRALEQVRDTGDYSGMSSDEMVAARQSVEDLIGLERFYEIEEQTVEDQKWGKR